MKNLSEESLSIHPTTLLRTRCDTIKVSAYKYTAVHPKSQGNFLGAIINELISDVLCSLKKGRLKHTMTSEIQNKNKHKTNP